jgi:hypothetical protein
MLTVPHGCYNSYTSNINNEVKKFNIKFYKYMKPSTHVTVIDVDRNGIFYPTWIALGWSWERSNL